MCACIYMYLSLSLYMYIYMCLSIYIYIYIYPCLYVGTKHTVNYIIPKLKQKDEERQSLQPEKEKECLRVCVTTIAHPKIH